MKIILLVLLVAKAHAQTNLTVTGQVRDASSGQELNGASITVLGQPDIGTGTNDRGWFGLSLPAGVYTMRVSYLGYVPQLIPLNLTRNELVNVSLKASDRRLNEVIVTGQCNHDKVMSTCFQLRTRSSAMCRAGRAYSLHSPTITKLPLFSGDKR